MKEKYEVRIFSLFFKEEKNNIYGHKVPKEKKDRTWESQSLWERITYSSAKSALAGNWARNLATRRQERYTFKSNRLA